MLVSPILAPTQALVFEEGVREVSIFRGQKARALSGGVTAEDCHEEQTCGLLDREPTDEELAAIEREWPAIRADLAEVNAAIAVLLLADGPVAEPTSWLSLPESVKAQIRPRRRTRRGVLRLVSAAPSMGESPDLAA